MIESHQGRSTRKKKCQSSRMKLISFDMYSCSLGNAMIFNLKIISWRTKHTLYCLCWPLCRLRLHSLSCFHFTLFAIECRFVIYFFFSFSFLLFRLSLLVFLFPKTFSAPYFNNLTFFLVLLIRSYC